MINEAIRVIKAIRAMSDILVPLSYLPRVIRVSKDIRVPCI